MNIPARITGHQCIAESRVPEQCCHRCLNLESANLSATAIALEDDDETIISTAGEK